MAPLGDVAPALELCAAASAGARLDVVRRLALDAIGHLVPADEVLWTEVDVARGVHGVQVARASAAHAPSADVSDDAVARRTGHLAHVAVHPAVGAEGCAPILHRRVDGAGGHQICLALPAPTGHRAGVQLHRSSPFTAQERARLRRALPVVACAVLAAWRAPVVDAGLLTAREATVLRSVATGMSDKQAARALGVSPRTIGKHLEHIYAKLGVGGRTEAAAQVGLLADR